MNEKPTIKVPLYRIEGVKGLQVGRCNCSGSPYENGRYFPMGLDKKCVICGLYYYDLLCAAPLEKTCSFVAWAYSTPERRG